MTEERYLIAHKVRGEPAFDVAIRMTCPACREDEPLDGDRLGTTPAKGCNTCEGVGFWWIIPTSGHRAHPWWWNGIDHTSILEEAPMPNDTPDHYQDSRAPAPSRPAFLDKLIKSKAPSTPIPRRGF